MPDGKITIEELGRRTKAKYPQYADMDDAEVGQKVLEKYPQYQDMIIPSGASAGGETAAQKPQKEEPPQAGYQWDISNRPPPVPLGGTGGTVTMVSQSSLASGLDKEYLQQKEMGVDPLKKAPVNYLTGVNDEKRTELQQELKESQTNIKGELATAGAETPASDRQLYVQQRRTQIADGIYQNMVPKLDAFTVKKVPNPNYQEGQFLGQRYVPVNQVLSYNTNDVKTEINQQAFDQWIDAVFADPKNNLTNLSPNDRLAVKQNIQQRIASLDDTENIMRQANLDMAQKTGKNMAFNSMLLNQRLTEAANNMSGDIKAQLDAKKADLQQKVNDGKLKAEDANKQLQDFYSSITSEQSLDDYFSNKAKSISKELGLTDEAQQQFNESYKAAAKDYYIEKNRKNYENFKNKPLNQLLQEGLDLGVDQMVQTIGGAAMMEGFTDFGNKAVQQANMSMEEKNVPDVHAVIGQFTPAHLQDPVWWATNAIPSLTMMSELMVPSIAVGYATGGTAEPAMLRLALSSIASGGTSRYLESMTEAGNTYVTAIQEGRSPEEAGAAAAKDFRDNMKLVGLDVVQYAAAFVPGGKLSALVTAPAKMAFEGSTEYFEEAYQQYAQDKNMKKFSGSLAEYMKTPQAIENGTIGALMGLGFGMGGDIASHITGKEAPSSDESILKSPEIKKTLLQMRLNGLIDADSYNKGLEMLKVATEPDESGAASPETLEKKVEESVSKPVETVSKDGVSVPKGVESVSKQEENVPAAPEVVPPVVPLSTPSETSTEEEDQMLAKINEEFQQEKPAAGETKEAEVPATVEESSAEDEGKSKLIDELIKITAQDPQKVTEEEFNHAADLFNENKDLLSEKQQSDVADFLKNFGKKKSETQIDTENRADATTQLKEKHGFTDAQLKGLSTEEMIQKLYDLNNKKEIPIEETVNDAKLVHEINEQAKAVSTKGSEVYLNRDEVSEGHPDLKKGTRAIVLKPTNPKNQGHVVIEYADTKGVKHTIAVNSYSLSPNKLARALPNIPKEFQSEQEGGELTKSDKTENVNQDIYETPGLSMKEKNGVAFARDLPAILEKGLAEQKPFRDAFMKRKGLTEASFKKLAQKRKDVLQEEWVASDEFKQLQDFYDNKEKQSSHATKKQSTNEVDVREPSGDGEAVGGGNAGHKEPSRKGKPQPKSSEPPGTTEGEKEGRVLSIAPAISEIKNRKPKTKRESETQQFLKQKPSSAREAILQWFIGGGRINTKDFRRYTGFGEKQKFNTRGNAEMRSYLWAYSNKARSIDNIANEDFIDDPAVRHLFVDMDEQDVINEIVDVLMSHDGKSAMLKVLKDANEKRTITENMEEQLATDEMALAEADIPIDNSTQEEFNKVDDVVYEEMSDSEVAALLDATLKLYTDENGKVDLDKISQDISGEEFLPQYYSLPEIKDEAKLKEILSTFVADERERLKEAATEESTQPAAEKRGSEQLQEGGESKTADTEAREIVRASPEDLSYDLAYNAYRNISFDPEKRAAREQQDYADTVNDFIDRMTKLAVTPEQKKLLAEQVARYKENYLRKYNAVLSAKSRTASTMITGPSNFPVERNRKALQTESNRYSEFADWKSKAETSIEKSLLTARTPEQVSDAKWTSVKKSITDLAATIIAIDKGIEKTYSRPLFVNGLKGLIERIAENGDIGTVTKAIAYIRELQSKIEKPLFADRNSIWQLEDVAKKAAEAKKEKVESGSETIGEYDGASIINNNQAERTQILFDAKPAPDVIAALKKEGWNWSPGNGAWQRKNTAAANASAKNIVSKFYTEKKEHVPEAPQEKVRTREELIQEMNAAKEELATAESEYNKAKNAYEKNLSDKQSNLFGNKEQRMFDDTAEMKSAMESAKKKADAAKEKAENLQKLVNENMPGQQEIAPIEKVVQSDKVLTNMITERNELQHKLNIVDDKLEKFENDEISLTHTEEMMQRTLKGRLTTEIEKLDKTISQRSANLKKDALAKGEERAMAILDKIENVIDKGFGDGGLQFNIIPLKPVLKIAINIVRYSLKTGFSLARAIDNAVQYIESTRLYKNLKKAGTFDVEEFRQYVNDKLKDIPSGGLDEALQRLRNAEKSKNTKEVAEMVSEISKYIEERSKGFDEVDKRYFKDALTAVRNAETPTQLASSIVKFEHALDRFIFRELYSTAKSTQSKVRRAAKADSTFANQIDVVEALGKMNIREIDDIPTLNQYLEAAQKFLDSKLAVNSPFYQPFDIKEAEEIIAKIQEQLDQKVIDRAEELSGVSGLTIDEAKQLLAAIDEDEEKTGRAKESPVFKRDKLIKAAEYTQLATKGILETSEDLTSTQKTELAHINAADFSKMTDEQLQEYIRTVNNFIVNGGVANLMRIGAISEATVKLPKLVEVTSKTKMFGLNMLQRTYESLPQMLKSITGLSDVAATIRHLTGMGDVFRGGSFTNTKVADIGRQWQRAKELWARAGIKDSRENRAMKSMGSHLLQHFGGNEADLAEALQIRKTQLEETFARLKKAGGKWAKDGEHFEKLYEEHFKNVKTHDEVEEVLKKLNLLDQVKWWQHQFEENKPNLKETTEGVYNEKFQDSFNYLPISYMQLGVETDIAAETQKRSLLNDLSASRPKQAPTTIRRIKHEGIPAGFVLNLDFDHAMFNKIKKSIYDTNTARPKLLFAEMMKMEDANKAFGGFDNKNKIVFQYNRGEAIQRGAKQEFDLAGQIISTVAHEVRRVGSTIALGGITQAPKQYVSTQLATAVTLAARGGLMHFINGLRVDLSAPLFNMTTLTERGMRLGGVERGESKNAIDRAKMEEGFSKFTAGLQTLEQTGSELALWSLKTGDVAAAKQTFASYYMEYLDRHGIKIKPSDISTEHEKVAGDETRQEALSYAEQMVDEMQVTNNAALNSALQQVGKSAWGEIVRNIFMPFSSFSTNQRARIVEGLKFAMHGTPEQRTEGLNRVGSATAEILSYQALNTIGLYLIFRYPITWVLKKLFGFDDDDDWEERLQFEWKKFYSNSLRDFVAGGTSTYGENGSLWIANQIAYGVQMALDKERPDPKVFYSYQGTSKASNYIGLYGIWIDKAAQTYKYFDGAISGDVTLETKFGDKEVFLSNNKRAYLFTAGLVNGMQMMGWMDADIARVMNTLADTEIAADLNAKRKESIELRTEAEKIFPEYSTLNRDDLTDKISELKDELPEEETPETTRQKLIYEKLRNVAARSKKLSDEERRIKQMGVTNKEVTVYLKSKVADMNEDERDKYLSDLFEKYVISQATWDEIVE